MRTALVTGVSGQDGAYLAKLLLSKGYRVFGTHRPTSPRDFWRLEELQIRTHEHLHLVEFQAVNLSACRDLVQSTLADEIYNLAGQTSAVAAVREPLETAEANGMAAVYLLEAIRRYRPAARFFQAGSSELFGEAIEVPQVETTAFYPTNPYGVAKLFAHWSAVNYRDVYGVFATSGILFNHESPLRGMEFVTRKITDGIAKIRLGMLDSLHLGNMDSLRDWGFAEDYASGMWASMQAAEPDTFIFATNQMHSVRQFVTLAGSAAGFDLTWEGRAENEIGIDRRSSQVMVRVDPTLYRPLEIHRRVGNPAKALQKLHWAPLTRLSDLCALMVGADLKRNARADS